MTTSTSVADESFPPLQFFCFVTEIRVEFALFLSENCDTGEDFYGGFGDVAYN